MFASVKSDGFAVTREACRRRLIVSMIDSILSFTSIDGRRASVGRSNVCCPLREGEIQFDWRASVHCLGKRERAFLFSLASVTMVNDKLILFGVSVIGPRPEISHVHLGQFTAHSRARTCQVHRRTSHWRTLSEYHRSNVSQRFLEDDKKARRKCLAKHKSSPRHAVPFPERMRVRTRSFNSSWTTSPVSIGRRRDVSTADLLPEQSTSCITEWNVQELLRGNDMLLSKVRSSLSSVL